MPDFVAGLTLGFLIGCRYALHRFRAASPASRPGPTVLPGYGQRVEDNERPGPVPRASRRGRGAYLETGTP